MRVAIVTLALFFGSAAALFYAASRIPPLPHRPDTGNHGQGHSTDARHCPPGSIPYFLDDGTFLECMR